MKEYIASIISISRVIIGSFLIKKYKSKEFLRDDSLFIIVCITWCILSDALDGIAARSFGSISIGRPIDFFSDRICMMYLLYFAIDNTKLLIISITAEILMSIWELSGLWPTLEQAMAIHPFFPNHIGRVSILIESSACLLLVISKFYYNKYVSKIGYYLLYFGIILTCFSVIYYPLMITASKL